MAEHDLFGSRFRLGQSPGRALRPPERRPRVSPKTKRAPTHVTQVTRRVLETIQAPRVGTPTVVVNRIRDARAMQLARLKAGIGPTIEPGERKMIEDLTPGMQRGFVHKRLIKAAGGFITGGPGGALKGFIAPSVRRPPPRSTTARPGAISAGEKEQGRAIKFPGITPFGGSRCVFPLRPHPVTGACVMPFLGDRPGRDDQPLQIGPGTGVGDAVMGRYGAALEPGSKIIDRAICLRGMVLGDDNLCYNRSQITNKERMWPRGRRPLLTGGDMRAISTAARAGRRLEGATKRLQKIGLMKKPGRRSAIAAKHHAK